jgi:hypothetical protein
MSRYNAPTLYALLPAVYRQRDVEHGEPLRDLFEIFGEQAAVLENEIQHLYENWFIETCDEWVVSYLGDLLGVRPTSAKRVSTRAEVADTLGYRRRKGTLAVVEQLARDVTGWPARAVEYFTLLSTTQNLNHLRMENHGTPDLRDEAALSRLGGPFERTAHLVDVRRIARRSGRYNIPNIGVHAWRLSAHELHRATAHQVDAENRLHYTFSQLGQDVQLFRRPQDMPRAFDSATERNVPDAIRRRVLNEQFDDLYGEQSSIAVWDGEDFIGPEQVAVCDLTGWVHAVSADRTIAIDPVLGRIAFAAEPAAEVRVRYHYGFSADIGCGTYDRSASAGGFEASVLRVGIDPLQEVPEGVERFTTIGEALAHWSALPSAERPDVIELDDNSTYSEEISEIDLPQGARLTIRAANRRRPTVLLSSELNIVGGEDADFEVNGLLIGNHGVRVSGQLRSLRITHCTLVPGRRLSEQGEPVEPGEASLTVEAGSSTVAITSSILGAIRTDVDVQVRVLDSVIDANGTSNLACHGLQDGESGGIVEIERATVVGRIRVNEVRLASDTLFLGMVEAVRRQQGCLRFSHVPLESIVPQRFRCQPALTDGALPDELERLALAVRPQFTSLRYGDPGYCQLSSSTPPEIRRGGEGESEMGAFSGLKQPQREDSLRVRLQEYVKLGTETGILYAT